MTKSLFLYLFLFIKYDSVSAGFQYYLLYSRNVATHRVTVSNVSFADWYSQGELYIAVHQKTRPHFPTFVDGQNYNDKDALQKNFTIDENVVISFWDTFPDYARFRNNGNDSYMDFFFYGCQQPIPENDNCLIYKGYDDTFCICNGDFRSQYNCDNGTSLHYGKCDDVMPTMPPATSTSDLLTTTSFYPSLKDLSEQNVTIDNAGVILNETVYYTEDPCSLTPDNVSNVATILEKCASVEDLPPQESQMVILNIDNVMSVSNYVMAQSNSSARFLTVISTLMLNMADKDLQFLDGVNLGLSSSSVICFLTSNDNGLVDLGNNFGMITDLSPQYDSHDSGIRVQVNDVCEETEVSQVYFTIYRSRILHQPSTTYATYKNKKERDRLVGSDDSRNGFVDDEDTDFDGTTPPSLCEQQLALLESSPVMAATVLSNKTEVSRLNQSDKTMAYLTFNTTNVLRPLHGQFIVTWWNYMEDVWSTYDQCTSEYHGNFVTAKCPHLTDMTLLVNGLQNDPSVCDKFLEDLSYLVNSLSVASLALLLFINLSAFSTELSRKRWMILVRGSVRQPPDILQTAYTADLLLFYLVFTIFSNQKISGDACEFFGALSYVLLMTSLFLTIFTAFRIVTMFLGHRLRILASVVTRPPVAMGTSFLLPFIVSLILFFTTPLFERNDGFCWIRPDLVIYSTIIPISVLLLNGLVCTIIVCRRIFGTERKFKRSGQFTEDNETKKKVIAVFIMQFTLGMPWILQYFTLYWPNTTAWHYIFTMIIGSQGTILGLLFLYKRRCTRKYHPQEKQKPSLSTENTDMTNASDTK